MRRRTTMASSIVLATALLVACGDDPESTAPGSTAPATTAAPTTSVPTALAPETTTATTTTATTATTTTMQAPTTTLAPETTVAVDPLLIAPGTIEDGIHVGYLVSQSPGSFAFGRADVAPDGSWSNTNPLVRTLPIATPLPLANGSPIVVVVQSQRVLDASSIVPATAPTPGATRYVVPSPDPRSSWADEHSSYPATDLFVPGGCGGEVVSPVDGTLLEVRRIDGYDPAVDNPATRGGRSISILGDDGVRYYLAHFAEIHPDIAVGTSVDAGQSLGTVGDSGRTSACHIHFGISPPCPEREWSVRRGVIWPFP